MLKSNVSLLLTKLISQGIDDELPEFSPKVLDSLRQLLESGEVTLARANHHITYPARIQLIAAMNPCRCGMAGEPGHVCVRGERCVTEYQARLSGPLLDRIDIRVELPSVKVGDLLNKSVTEKSEQVANRVAIARNIQKIRYNKLGLDIHCNAYCPSHYLDQILNLSEDGKRFLNKFTHKIHLSARAFHRVLKVARTLADLEQQTNVTDRHIAEAASYR